MKIDNPDFDYEQDGIQYAGHRKADERIAACIHAALGDARTVLNVGAGAGSYEPEDKYVVAVEPSASMRSQRRGKVPAINATADALPFDNDAFDASMALITVHHWPDMKAGLKEMRRVTKGQVLILTFDPAALHEFWNVHYFKQLIEVEKARYPEIDAVREALGGTCEVQAVPVPFDCTDGFQEAFYGRPEAFLDREVRRAQSAWGFLPDGAEEHMVQSLRDDLASGAWDAQYGHHRHLPQFTGALRLIIAHA